jgi:nucleolar GTP-binding protein
MALKNINTVPTAEVLIDTCLGKTNRRTPTVIHRHYAISRIRAFYLRKIRHAASMYKERLDEITETFPKIDEVHPFLGDLINVLYDRDHYKMALGHVKAVSGAIANVDKEYSRLVKYGDSLYRCKQLKRAALGKMSTMAKKLAKTLVYLEEVRQNLMRMPDIDPSTRTLLICGYPNVGKSSFMNTITRAQVDVQPYAFTTKSLFVGHFDHKHLRWQAIDTPGILDHPIESRNTIEMQSITALAHLRACVVYFLDISETCGYSIREQLSLFTSLRPLFFDKQVLFVVSKCDIRRIEELGEEERREVFSVIGEFRWVSISSVQEENIDLAKNMACEELLASRVEIKLQKERIEAFKNMLDIKSPSFDPEVRRVEETGEFGKREATQRELEMQAREQGRKYIADFNKHYFVKDEWKYDAIPEIIDGKNIADFIDRDIEEKVLALEKEEEHFVESVYGKKYNLMSPEEMELRERILCAQQVRKKESLSKSRATVPGSFKLGALSKKIASRAGREGDMDVSEMPRADSRDLKEGPLARISEENKRKISRVNKVLSEKVLRGKTSESDKLFTSEKPRHLFSGKRGVGKNQRR